jgi:MiaB/RimO family radical SAM methylthiotransferase
VLLSLDETYADVAPVRTGANRVSAYVSVMRGCDNMCSYCIVPFTRGRERSRPADSVVAEVRALAEQGFREVVLLGQNVNSYNFIPPDVRAPLADTFDAQSRGFRNISRRRESEAAVRFAELVDLVASVSAEMRVRFTSPHPKDFADELLHVIRDRPNVCKQVHLPAQSGSSAVLARMRRGYTREAYLDLVRHVRATVPGVALSSDFIAGFCGETEEEHAETLSLIREVGYDHAFMFAYSQREKTHAHRTYADDVPEDVKGRRLRQVIDTFQEVARTRTALEVGKTHLVLVEGRSRKSERDLSGRTDGNRTVNFARAPVKGTRDAREAEPAVGEYVEVKITGATSVSLQGVALRRTTLQAWSEGGREM